MSPFLSRALAPLFKSNRKPSTSKSRPKAVAFKRDPLIKVSLPTDQDYTPASLLGLPGELRNRIYDYYFDHEGDATKYRTLHYGVGTQMNLLSTCRLLYHEVYQLVIDTQPALVDLFQPCARGSLLFISHTRPKVEDILRHGYGSVRCQRLLLRQPSLSHIKVLVIRHLEWEPWRMKDFYPMSGPAFRGLQPEHIIFHGFYCAALPGGLFGHAPLRMESTISFLLKHFVTTKRVSVYFCIDGCELKRGNGDEAFSRLNERMTWLSQDVMACQGVQLSFERGDLDCDCCAADDGFRCGR